MIGIFSFSAFIVQVNFLKPYNFVFLVLCEKLWRQNKGSGNSGAGDVLVQFFKNEI